MYRILVVIAFMLIFTGITAQPVQFDLTPLTSEDLLKLASIPELPYTPGDNPQVLPYALDNSAPQPGYSSDDLDKLACLVGFGDYPGESVLAVL